MSAYAEVKTEFTDPDVLREALIEIYGCKPELVQLHESPVNLIDYRGKVRPDVANIVVPGCGQRHGVGQVVPGASNDIGFVRGENGSYKAIISEYDSAAQNAAWLGKLTAIYAEKKLMQNAKKNGMNVTKKIVGGKIVLALTKYV